MIIKKKMNSGAYYHNTSLDFNQLTYGSYDSIDIYLQLDLACPGNHYYFTQHDDSSN